MLTYETVQAPPATVLLHPLHFQIPTECLLTVFFPQNVQMYRACCVISIFFTCFRRDAPYLWRKISIPLYVTVVNGVGSLNGLSVRVDVLSAHTLCHIYRSHRPLHILVSTVSVERSFSKVRTLGSLRHFGVVDEVVIDLGMLCRRWSQDTKTLR